MVGMLDEEHGKLIQQNPRDENNYTLGKIGSHNVVIVCLPSGNYGNVAATAVVVQMLSTFRSIKFGLMVGVAGGIPSANDIRLGDVVVSKPIGTYPGVIQYDFGKTVEEGKTILVGTLNKPPKVLLTAMAAVEADHLVHGNNIGRHISAMFKRHPEMKEDYAYPGVESDQLYEARYHHAGGAACSDCDASKIISRPARLTSRPEIFYGTVGSGNKVIKDGATRDKLSQENNIICFEMEAAGIMDSFPCLVIRGICDYADSHKNKLWQRYAAATAAAYAKEILYATPITEIDQTAPTMDSSAKRTHRLLLGLAQGPPSYDSTLHSRPSASPSKPVPLPPSVFLLTNRLYPKNDIELASLVPNQQNPSEDALADIALEEGRDYSISVDRNFSHLISTRTKSSPGFKKAISKLFLRPIVKEVEDDIQIVADESRLYTLKQPRSLFKRFCESVDVKYWLQGFAEEEQDVHFIVSYRTLLDAHFIANNIRVKRGFTPYVFEKLCSKGSKMETLIRAY
ncbi:hypothetical protein ABW19_dt0205443 [Dactylella cylindrospora]|nr:hypothetical protein ABW19_dt0205443 [Dactylella cylindrospora]